MQTDRQTNMTKLTVAFSNFVNMPKNYTSMETLSLKQSSKRHIKENIFQTSIVYLFY